MKNRSNSPTSVPSLPYPEVRLDREEGLPLVEYPEQAPDPRFALQARPRDWSSRIEPFDDRPPRPGPIAPPRPRVPLTRDLIRPNFFGQYFGRYGFPPLELAFRPRVVSRSLPLFDLGLVYDRVPRLLGYPPRCRINGVATPDGELVIGYIERRSGTPNDRVFRVARVDMRPGSPTFGGLIGSRPVLHAARESAPNSQFGLRSTQCAYAPSFPQPVLFPIVESYDSTTVPIHLIAAVGGSWTVGPVLGLEDPQPAPAAIAFGRMGLTERVAFAYPRWRGTGTEVELGFVEPAGSAWMFRRAAAVSAPSPVYDNPALVFDSLRGEWMLAFVPQDYTPGAFAQRLTFDGRPIGPGPTVVAVGDGDMDPGPHGGISLAYNARTGRFALAVSHNLVRFEPSGDTIVPVRNGGGPARLDTAPMSTLDLPDPFRVVSPGGPLVALYGRGGVFAVGACHAPQLEFRSGGVQLWYERPQVGISLWSSEPGPGFVTGSEGTLWAEVLSSEEAFLHAYVESPWSPLVAALYVRLNVPEPGRGRVFATLIEDA